MDEPWLQALVRSGWIVASSDFHTDSWGNEASTEDTTNLIAWAEEQTDGQPIRLYVSGSMGASVSLNAMTHAELVPPCWYGVKPAVDLTKMDNVPGAARLEEAALPLNPGCTTREAISDGEDYELLFAIAPKDSHGLLARWAKKFPNLLLTRIGRLNRRSKIENRKLPHGFVHFEKR